MIDPLRQFKSEISQGLANPTRIAMIELLREGELSAGNLIEKLGVEQARPFGKVLPKTFPIKKASLFRQESRYYSGSWPRLVKMFLGNLLGPLGGGGGATPFFGRVIRGRMAWMVALDGFGRPSFAPDPRKSFTKSLSTPSIAKRSLHRRNGRCSMIL